MSDTFRGYEITDPEQDGTWVFTDTGEPVSNTYASRPCGYCSMTDTPEGHDACLGTLPGVINACCGHGEESEAYIQFSDNDIEILRGAEVTDFLLDPDRC